MERHKKLLLGVLTAILIIILIEPVISVNSHSMDRSNGTLIENSVNYPDLNNKTNGLSNEKIIENEAIFIAELNSDHRELWFDDNWDANILLSSNSQYWKVEVCNDDPEHYEDHLVLVNVKNGDSQVDSGRWRSFDEIKAFFVTELYAGDADPRFEIPQLITLNGEKIWSTYYYEGGFSRDDGQYVYFDPVTGKSELKGGKWRTLKELDEDLSKDFEFEYRDVLRDLYPDT